MAYRYPSIYPCASSVKTCSVNRIHGASGTGPTGPTGPASAGTLQQFVYNASNTTPDTTTITTSSFTFTGTYVEVAYIGIGSPPNVNNNTILSAQFSFTNEGLGIAKGYWAGIDSPFGYFTMYGDKFGNLVFVVPETTITQTDLSNTNIVYKAITNQISLNWSITVTYL